MDGASGRSPVLAVITTAYHKIEVPARQEILIVSRESEEGTRVAFTVCHQDGTQLGEGKELG